VSIKENKINIKTLISFTVLTVVLAFLLSTGAIAKYVNEEKQETLYEAQAFYLESSTLTDESSIPTYTLQKGTNAITVDLKNFIDELRISDVAINYVVSISDTSGNYVTDKSGARINEKTGTFTKQTKVTKNESFTNLNSGTYTVTVRAVSPYTKTIRANFIVTDSDNVINYTVNDVAGSSVLQLTVTTNEFSGNIVIAWPAGLAPDSTDEKFSGVNTGFSAGSCTVNFSANSEYTFQFFKQTPSNKFVKGDISVTAE